MIPCLGSAAAIDVGSNTVHLLLGHMDADGTDRLEPLDDQSLLIGLAQDVYADGRIDVERIAEAADAVASLTQRARDAGAGAILLVATAAVRDAANRDELVAAVRERTGLELRIIDGEREAQLTYRGAVSGEQAPSADTNARRRQVCDVGGGSTEVIRFDGEAFILQTSLPLGSSRLSRGFTADPPAQSEVERVSEQVRQELDRLPRWRPDRLIVTGGTASALLRLAGGHGRRYELPLAELDDLRTVLAQHPAREIAGRYGIDAKRAALLPAGAAIIAALGASAGVDQVVLTACGLRDGMLVEYCSGQ